MINILDFGIFLNNFMNFTRKYLYYCTHAALPLRLNILLKSVRSFSEPNPDRLPFLFLFLLELLNLHCMPVQCEGSISKKGMVCSHHTICASCSRRRTRRRPCCHHEELYCSDACTGSFSVWRSKKNFTEGCIR